MNTITTSSRSLRFAAFAAAAIGLSACSGGDDGDLPTITSFTATPTTVASGESASLAWVVVNATKITITGGADNIESADASGMASTGPLTANTTFTLTAENADGMTATQTVMVSIQGVGGPTVDSFTANPAAIAPGGSADLTWMTTDATTVEITAGATTIVMDGAADGSFTVMPDADTTYTLIASDADGNDSPASTVTIMVTTAPAVQTFTANPTTVDAGMPTTLSWEVINANSIIVTDDQANEVYNGTDLMGSAMDSPTQTTTYTITITDGTDTDTDTVTVTVNPPAGASIQSFTASPMMAVDGQNVDLSWATTDADRIEIDDGVSIAPIHTSTDASGTYTTQMLPQDVTYTLTAFNPMGDATAMVTVTLSMAAPVVNDFSANPSPGRVGGVSTLSWDVAAAATINIADGMGTVIVTATTAAAGTFDVTLAGPTNDYTLTATNQFGTTMATVSILADAAAASINTFTVSPDIGTDPAMVTIDYDVTAARTLELLANGTPMAAFPFTPNGMTQDAAGQFMTTVSVTTRFELVATNGAGTDSDNATVVVVMPGSLEMEPNDTATQAMALPGMMPQIAGSIGVPGDADYYSVVVPAGGFVRAETSDGAGGCAFDTLLVFYDVDGTTELARQDDIDGANNRCSRLEPSDTAALRDLPAGTYFIRVQGFGNNTGGYVLDILTGPPGCGNTVQETGETCDDGNTTAGDGCSDTCQIEPNQTFSAPGAAQTLTANIVNVGDTYIVQVNVTAASYLRAETFEVASTMTCDNANTVLRLLDDTGASLGTDSFGGVGDCSRIDENDGFARLDVGTFLLTVEESGNNAAIAALELVVEGVAADICGNGVIEGALNETCDDGNTTAGDGCSATCQQEAVLAYSAPGAPATFSTPITVAGLQPFITVTVTAESYLRAQTFDDAVAGTCTADSVLRLFDSGGVELGSDDDGGVGACSHIDPNVDAFARLAAGTYTVRVEEFGNNGTFDPLETVLEGITVDICGNGVVEAGFNEVCDDGNTTAGDGCDATCQLEALPTITVSPGSTQTLVGQSIPLGLPNLFPVTVTAELYFAAENFVDSVAGTCTGLDTDMTLLQSDGVTTIVADDFDGVGSCSLINVANDGQLVRLAAGSYFLQIEEEGNNAAVASYDLVVDGIAVDVCGNGVTELAETCDDGNTTAGDGCSATCTVEPAGVIALAPGSNHPFLGRALAIGQQDTFTITVAAPVYISAETFVDSVAGTCTGLDTDMTLLQSDGVTTIVADDFDGVDSCSLISPVQDDQLARLAAGTYFLRIEEDGNNAAVAAYDLIVNGIAVDVCGNGVTEAGVAETCDDGNTTAGDGCSATCTIEPAGVIALAPGSSQTFLNQSLAVGVTDIYTINVTAEAYISAETFEDSVAGTCATPDTVIRLFAPDGVTEIVTDDEGGVDSCSLLNPANDGQLTRLAVGTYFLQVEDFLVNTAIADYDLVVNGIAVDICGNGLIEATNNETCDDGNTVAGDGCDAVCAFEGLVEAEPNDAAANATSTTLNGAGAVSIAAGITPVGDVDYYSFVVPAAGASVTAQTYGTIGDVNTCNGDTVMFIEDAAGTQVTTDDDGGTSVCSLISNFALTAGTYYIRIIEFGNNGTVDYLLDVSLQ